MDAVIFQLLLWALLFGPSLLSFGGPTVMAATWLIGVAALIFHIRPLPSGEKKVATAMAIVHAVLSLVFIVSLLHALDLSVAFPAPLIGYALFYIWLKKPPPHCEGIVLGYDGGYAIVRIGSSVVAWSAPGEYAVAAGKPVKKGQKVRVLFDAFSRKGRIA